MWMEVVPENFRRDYSIFQEEKWFWEVEKKKKKKTKWKFIRIFFECCRVFFLLQNYFQNSKYPQANPFKASFSEFLLQGNKKYQRMKKKKWKHNVVLDSTYQNRKKKQENKMSVRIKKSISISSESYELNRTRQDKQTNK